MNHEDYMIRRAELSAIRDDSFDAFDKSILTLSTGCLVLSITFLDKIGRPFNKVTFFLIFSSWAVFLMVIVFNLFSYLFAKSNMDRKIDELDNKYKKELKTQEADDNQEAVYWQNKATRFCNTSALILFCTGVLTILIYASLIQINNYSVMKETKVMSENKKTQINKGKIEAPKAVTTPVDPNKINTHGKTESPQAVIRPSKPKEKK